jgi:hypothetical protein
MAECVPSNSENVRDRYGLRLGPRAVTTMMMEDMGHEQAQRMVVAGESHGLGGGRGGEVGRPFCMSVGGGSRRLSSRCGWLVQL